MSNDDGDGPMPEPSALEPPADFVESDLEAEGDASNVVPFAAAAAGAAVRKRKPKPKARAAASDEKPTYALLCRLLRADYGPRLSYDRMREAPCLDRAPLRDADVGVIREYLERDHGLAFGGENVQQGVKQIAEEHSFHPVKDYLRGLLWDGVVRIPRVGPEILGITGELEQVMIRRWFVSAVARGLEPGCKVDTSLVLVGPQGYRKSSFFSVLGGEWFCDTHVDLSDKDGMLQLAAAWIYEWPEIDRVTHRRHASDVKAFLSKRDDTFRPPFGRSVIRHPRACVVVGSTNEARYLVDPSGSRRFWTLVITARILLERLIEWRDQLWAEAVVAFDQGEPWWLDESDELRREDAARDSHAVDDEDPWQTQIEYWLRTTWHAQPRQPAKLAGDSLTLSRVLSEGLRLGIHQQDRAAQVRATKILRDLGYENPRLVTPIGRIRHWTNQPEAAKAESDELEAEQRATEALVQHEAEQEALAEQHALQTQHGAIQAPGQERLPMA